MGNNLCVERNPEEGQLVVKEEIAVSKSRQAPKARPEAEHEFESNELTQVQAQAQTDVVTYGDSHTSMAEKIQGKWRDQQTKKGEKEAKVNGLKILEENASKHGRYISVEETNQETSEQVLLLDRRLGPFNGTSLDKARLAQNLVLRKPFKYNIDDSIYHGFWNLAGLREGYGYMVRADGSKLEGLWKEGEIIKGRIINTDGSYYEGKISNSMANGEGTFFDSKGTTNYIGSWHNGKHHGFGMWLLGDGAIYKGTFINGEFQGQGNLTWGDKSNYEGDFEESALNGQGVYKSSDGSVYTGSWSNNQPQGPGRFNWKSTGSSYVGEYRHGKKDGKGVYTTKDIKYDGSWSSGKPHGHGLYTTKDFTVTGTFRHGHLVQTTSQTGETVPDSLFVNTEKEAIFEGSEMAHVRHVYNSKNNSPTKHYKPMNEQHQELFDIVRKSSVTAHN